MKKNFLRTFIVMSFYSLVIQLLFAGTLLASTDSRGQNIENLELKLDTRVCSLKEFFNQVERESDYRFFYVEGEITENNRIMISAGSQNLKEMLQEVANQELLQFKIINDIVVVTKSKLSKPEVIIQEGKKIIGRVTDDRGEPLPGATVMVKETTIGATTDGDGNYFLEMPNDAQILVFSFIGMESQEIRLNGQSTVDIRLSASTIGMDEVVVTAIGIQREKKKLGYSTQEVQGDKMSEAGNLNAATALSGRVAGLTVSNPSGMFQTPSFSLRGNAPLVVLDGVPIESDLFDLSSNDIESVNVLKGAAASALYGSRGKYGAIMISTKRADQEGLTVEFSSKNMMNAGFLVFPKTQSQYGSGSNGQYEFWDGEGGGKSDDDMTWGPKLDVGNLAPQWNSPIRDKQTGEVIPWWGSVKDTQYDDKSRYERVPTEMVSHDNLKDFLRTGLITNNSITISYKGDKSSHVAVGQYAFQRGQAPTTSLSTGSLNVNSTFNLTDKLTLHTKLGYNMVSSPNFPDYGYHPSNYIYTIVEWMGADVNGQELKEHQWVPGLEGYRQANYNYAWYNNPYFAIEQSKRIEHRNILTGQARLEYRFTPDLNIMGRASLRMNDRLRENHIPKSYMNYGDSRDGDYKVWNYRQSNIDADVLATYTKNLVDNISLTTRAGASVFHRNYRNDYISTDGLNIPGIYSISNSKGSVIAYDADNGWGIRNEKEIRSVYGAIELDLSHYLYLTVTGRNDWTSTLAVGNNSYFYPSVSLSSVISDYTEMPEMFDFLKVMGSWTTVSSDLDPYRIKQVYSKLDSWGTTVRSTYPSALNNYNINPQSTTSWEVGLSTSLWKRFSLDLTYYHILDFDQIVDNPTSKASGATSTKTNGYEYTTNGWELMLGVKAIKKTDFAWNFNVNLSTRVKRLTKLEGGAEYYKNFQKGDRADTYFATVWLRRPEDGKLILNIEGQPIKDAYSRALGHIEPNLRFGWENNFRMKDFTINANFDGALGGLISSQLSGKLWWGGKHPESVRYRDEQYANGAPVYVPDAVVVTGGDVSYDVHGNITSDTRTYTENTTAVDWQSWSQNYPYRASVTAKQDELFANVFSRSYLKLRHLSIAYDCHKLLRTGGLIKGVTVSAFGNNLAILKKAQYIDPDISGDTGNDDGAADPTARYVGVGVNVKF